MLRRAADIASVEGLDGLTIGRLASELAVSKSGVFAHFGSKEELQLATIRSALELFADEVVTPALEAPDGLSRLLALTDRWIEYAATGVFPGGCFFFSAAAEFDARPGRVRDELARYRRGWLELYESTIRAAQNLGEIQPDANPTRLAFEFDALGMAANLHALLCDDVSIYYEARAAMRDRLRAIATDPNSVPVPKRSKARR